MLRLIDPGLYTEPARCKAWLRLSREARDKGVSMMVAVKMSMVGAAVCLAITGSALAAEGPAASRVKTILAFGDSLTAGHGVPSGDAYPARLERRLRAEGLPYRVINAGVSGETTAGGMRRVEWALRSRPDLAIVELGANDGLRGLSVAEMRANLARIIERFQAAGVTVVLAGMKVPPNYGPEYSRAFSSVFPELAARYRIPLIPFFLEGVAGHSGLNQPDGLHPTSEGYGVIVDGIWPVLQPLLKPA
ncbi:MAG: arylesterase [Nitrospiria bacterium]